MNILYEHQINKRTWLKEMSIRWIGEYQITWWALHEHKVISSSSHIIYFIHLDHLARQLHLVYFHNPNSTTTQLNITKVGFENDFTPPPPSPTTGNSTSSISQLLLIQSWPNFKGWFLGITATTWTRTTTTTITTSTTTITTTTISQLLLNWF